MGWSVGFTCTEQDAPDVTLVTVDTFSEGMRWLEAHIVSILDDLPESDTFYEEYQTLLADIQDISQDSGIMDDPDQWEDEDFWYATITFWITQD